MKILKLPAIFQAPGFFSECPNVWAKVKIFFNFLGARIFRADLMPTILEHQDFSQVPKTFGQK
jgi:hypothetical protein